METRNIVVGIDFSEYSKAALEEAAWIARRVDAELILVHVAAPPLPGTAALLPSVRVWEEIVEQRTAQEGLQAKAWAQEMAERGLPATHRLLTGDPVEQVVTLAEEEKSEMIVVGTHGLTGIESFLMGSIAQGVVRSARTNVWVARNALPWQDGPKQILLATDFSERAEDALAVAIHLAPDDSTIDIVHCWQPPLPVMPPAVSGTGAFSLADLTEDLARYADARGEDLMARHATSRVKLNFTALAGPAASTVLAYARRESASYDLIVTGSHGRRGLRRFLLGSVAEKIVRNATSSTLVVHGSADHPATPE